MDEQRADHGDRVNEVRLSGRVSAAAEERVLPSGDRLVVGRLVVPRVRSRTSPGGRRSPTVDVVDLVGWSARARRSMLAWSVDDEVALTGVLRRRFYRSGGATASRVEVEVTTARRTRRAATG